MTTQQTAPLVPDFGTDSSGRKLAIICSKGNLDMAYPGLVLANAALGEGVEVHMFFTFWGLNALRKTTTLGGKSFFQKMMAVMSPSSTAKLPVSKMNYFGVGARMLRTMMKQRNVTSLEDLIALAGELQVKTVACEMSRDVMGVSDAEMRPGVEAGGVASFLADALKSRVTLFI